MWTRWARNQTTTFWLVDDLHPILSHAHSSAYLSKLNISWKCREPGKLDLYSSLAPQAFSPLSECVCVVPVSAVSSCCWRSTSASSPWSACCCLLKQRWVHCSHHILTHFQRAVWGLDLCLRLGSSIQCVTYVFLFRIRRRTGSGRDISETCHSLLPLCWYFSPQPITLMVHNQSDLLINAIHFGDLTVIFKSDLLSYISIVMLPAYSLNRAYSIFFVMFSVIGKKLFSVSERQL